MKKMVLALAISTGTLCSCHKSTGRDTATVTESAVISDFVQKTALPQYAALQAKATTLNNAVITLNTSPTDANLSTAQQAWRDARSQWESCEGFLFGPVEDNNYDPNMDTWPIDYLEVDSLIASAYSFTVNSVDTLIQPLRGFHPLEFILWGQSGNATAASITAGQKQYMLALAQDVLNTVTALNTSWRATGGNYQLQILNAGAGSTTFTSRKDLLLAIANAMADICNEVGQQATGGKIYDPFSASDSFKTESPFSHNSMTDFKNNITGAQNVYLCLGNGADGASISNLVAAKNLLLDNKIKAQFAAAIAALNGVSVNFETAIFTQRTQLQSAMTALNTLQETRDSDLKHLFRQTLRIKGKQ